MINPNKIKLEALKYLGVLFLLTVSLPSFSQKNDTIINPELSASDSLLLSHSPMKASIMSAIVPGLGQAYNKKYWKIPLVYVGLGAGVYFITYNYQYYNLAKQVYIDREAGLTPSSSDYDFHSNAQLLDEIETFRRYTEISVIATAAIYVLNIVDASVDAHLFHFDVSNDLAFNFQPLMFPYPSSNNTFVGGSIVVNF